MVRRTLVILLLYLFLFAGMFVLAVIAYFQDAAILAVGGISPKMMNLALVMMSFVGVIKTFYHIVTI